MPEDHVARSQEILRILGMDDERSNERSAMVFLALAGLDKETPWKQATNQMLGTRAIMDWIRDKFDVDYKPNTRETIRRFTLHQFIQGGLVEENADDPLRPVNSPKWNYRLSRIALEAIRRADDPDFVITALDLTRNLEKFQKRYREERAMLHVPVTLPNGKEISLTVGGQNTLIKQIVDEFCPRFAPGGAVLYIDDASKTTGGIDYAKLEELNIKLPQRGKAPDLIVWLANKNWLFLMEACSTHGPIDVTRKEELIKLFGNCKNDIVFVSCFPNRKIMQRYLAELAWETEAWCADSPDHMIHLDGEKFLGPYAPDYGHATPSARP